MEFIYPRPRRRLEPLCALRHITTTSLRRRIALAIARRLFPARAMEVVRMFDILYIAIGIAAFLILTLYVFACDRL